MKRNLVLGAGRGPRVEVLERIKRSAQGMTVKDLSEAMGMSYMGVKAHCVALATAGYLTTWRQSAPKGRPYLFYRLSDSGEDFFDESHHEIALDLLAQAHVLFGPNAPQKLLLMYFRSLAVRYREMMDAAETSVIERARSFARIREKEGRMSTLTEGSGGECLLKECHNPLLHLMKCYPESRAMEERMVADVIGSTVIRGEGERAVVFSFRASLAS